MQNKKPKPSYRDLVRAINSAYRVLAIHEQREAFLIAELKKYAPDHVIFKPKKTEVDNASPKKNDPLPVNESGELPVEGNSHELGTPGLQSGAGQPVGDDTARTANRPEILPLQNGNNRDNELARPSL